MSPSATVDASLWIDGNGEVLGTTHTRRNEVTGEWKFVVGFYTPDRGKPVELRAHLKRGREALSETWSYILPAG
jgi:glucans biosynthesis protein